MAFDKTSTTTPDRTKFDLDNSNDLRIIKEFEEELKPYGNRTLAIFGQILTGWTLYLHESNFFRFSKKYPDGAVYLDNLRAYNFARMKYDALRDLQARRKYAQEKETENFKSLDLATA